jgi:flagellar biosynthetic protein FliR
MEEYLQQLVNTQFHAFLMIFMRFGLALMIMPGIGDSFVPGQVRLLFALALSLVLTPPLAAVIPPAPSQTALLVGLLASEAMIGLFIGTVMRVLISALDTAGSIVSMQIGFSSALLFNPVSGGQGSLIGSLYAMLGVTLLMVLNLHHYLIATIVDSYITVPATGAMPDLAAFAEIVARTVTLAFKIGVLMAMPFIVIGLIVQAGAGVLGRLMPQLQIFFLLLPGQILIGLMILTIVLSTSILYWANSYEATVAQALAP